MNVAVGIDLGTTNTVVGAMVDGEPATLADAEGRRLIPSTVSFHPSGKVLVGYAATDRRLVDPENTIHSVKRLIGRGWTSKEVTTARARFPFRMKEGPNHDTIVVARGEGLTLPEVSAFVLRQAKATAEAALGDSVECAVITVPASFNDLQRAATKLAGELADLEVLRILNEPTAAALAYGEEVGHGRRERIAVYDLGGGTFDFTLLELSGDVFEVLATAGDTSLGGDDIDELIAERIAADILQKTHYDATAHAQVFGHLRLFAEYMKRELSTKEEAVVSSKDITGGQAGQPIPFRYQMTRRELEMASLPLLDRTLEVCSSAMERAGLDIDRIDRIVLVGGSTRMPMIPRIVDRFFQKEPLALVNPEEAVALGAAIQAEVLRGGSRRRAPASSSRIEAMPEPRIGDESTAIEPGPLVKGRAGPAPAIEVASKPPGWTPPLLIDVTPLSLCVEIVGGYADVLINANTPVPCDRTRVFLTASDNQTSVVLRVAQGESRVFQENALLGELELSGLQPAPRGGTAVLVTFVIDVDGLLNVHARDHATGRETSARMRPFGAQTEPQQIAAMYARQDRYDLG